MNISSCIDAIASISLFRNFTKQELIHLFKSKEYMIKQYEKSQVVHLQHEICSHVDIVLEGEVAVQNITENGNILTLSIFSPQDIIGANLIFASSNYYPMTVAVVSSASILHMQRELIIRLCKNSENFMVGFMNSISDRSIFLTDKINALSGKTIRKSILDFLTYESMRQKSPVVKLPLSKKDLAERLGVQRTSLSRELNKMRKDGLLEYDARTITLMNTQMKPEEPE